MILNDCQMKPYVRTGTLFNVRKTWEARSHMLKIAGNYAGDK